MAKGSCLCGDMTYEFDPPYNEMHHCHCSMCRKAHGSAFATYISAPPDQLRWISGEDRVVRYESSPGFHRGFCPKCGSVTPDTMSDSVYVPVGALHGDPGERVGAHIFVASKAGWYEITDDIPQHDDYTPNDDEMVIEQASRGAGRPGVVGGSCLCGEVAFEYEGEPKFMLNCHCSRCRLAKGAAHASNVFVAEEALRWLRGEQQVTLFALPGAQRFGNAFCQTCGSSMPRKPAGGPMYNVPAGSLDDDPGVRPKAHIYVGSKAPWFEPTDALPRHEEMPPG